MPIKVDKKNKSSRVEILRAGNFERRFQDDLKITLSNLEELKKNFDSNVRRQELSGSPALPFNFSHDSWAGAAGWITGLEIGRDSNNFDALFASVDWTDKGAKKIRENEFRFVSSEFNFNYKDNESGKKFDIVLGGAALTNVPFIRDMEAVELSESKSGNHGTIVSIKLSDYQPDSNRNTGLKMPFDEILKSLESVSEEDKKKLQDAVKEETQKLSEKVSEMEKGIKETKKVLEDAKKDGEKLKLSEKELEKLKAKMSGSDEVEDRLKLSEGQVKDLTGKVSSLTKTIAEKAKTSEFDQMLSEGKVCEAQREPFMKDDMADFVTKQQEFKLDEAGSGGAGSDSEDDAQDKVQKLAEKKMETDKELSYGQAVGMVLSENPKLNKELDY